MIKRYGASVSPCSTPATMSNNYAKARINKTQQNHRCRLYGDKDETSNYIINECSKFMLKQYMTRHDWVGKVTQSKLCKKFRFCHANKWYILNPEFVLENETQNFLEI